MVFQCVPQVVENHLGQRFCRIYSRVGSSLFYMSPIKLIPFVAQIIVLWIAMLALLPLFCSSAD